jgi:hypothetical protein
MEPAIAGRNKLIWQAGRGVDFYFVERGSAALMRPQSDISFP